MITFKKINLNPSYYLFNDIEDIDPNFLRINKNYIKNTDVVIHEIKYIMTQNNSNQNIDNEVRLCVIFSDVDAYIIAEKKI